MLLLSRFWYLILAAVAAIAVAAAMLAQGIINRQSDSRVESRLRRDRIELDAMLSIEARRRMDSIAFITVEPAIAGVLRKAASARDTERLGKLNIEAKDAMKAHFKSLAEAAPGDEMLEKKIKRVKPDIAMALDREGRIIAQTGPLTANPPGTSMATFPLIKRTLMGYVRDDVWAYDRHVYRMAGRPVIHGGQYAGAVVHGYEIDEAFVKKLARSLGGASLAFFYGTTILSSYTPSDLKGALTREQMAASLQKALNDPKFKKGECTDSYELNGNGFGIFSLVKGSAAEVQVGYVIARPRDLLDSPLQVLDSATEDDVKSLPLGQLIGVAVFLFLLGLLWLFFEHDRPFLQLIRKTEQIVRNERDRLIITEWRTAYRKLADTINQAIDREVEKAAEMMPSTRKKVDLDEILGPTPDTTSSEAFFGFSLEQPGIASGDEMPKAPPAAAKPSASALMPAPAAPQKRDPLMPPVPPVPPGGASSAVKTPAPSVEVVDDEKHFKEVFEAYLATRKECGESVDGMSYEKFSVTLRKNRDQILLKHDAKAVRFTVYVKAGKASLKASPIRK